jgi:hypothetical protein
MLKVVSLWAVLALSGSASSDVAPESARCSLPSSQQVAVSAAQECCKVCRKGKACGDSCIARDKYCHRPPGCACDE